MVTIVLWCITLVGFLLLLYQLVFAIVKKNKNPNGFQTIVRVISLFLLVSSLLLNGLICLLSNKVVPVWIISGTGLLLLLWQTYRNFFINKKVPTSEGIFFRTGGITMAFFALLLFVPTPVQTSPSKNKSPLVTTKQKKSKAATNSQIGQANQLESKGSVAQTSATNNNDNNKQVDVTPLYGGGGSNNEINDKASQATNSMQASQAAKNSTSSHVVDDGDESYTIRNYYNTQSSHTVTETVPDENNTK